MDKTKYNKYQAQYQLARYHRRRKLAIETLGGKCYVCGDTERLELDHIDYRTKSFSISRLWSVSEVRFSEELAKCQILCHDHHVDKTKVESKERRPITHGKMWAAYKHKCGCPLCCQFRAEYKRKR